MRRIHPDVEDELRTLLALGDSPTRALNRLAQDHDYADRLPSLRTAERMAAEVRPGKGDRWAFVDADPTDARVILPVLAAVEGYGSLSRETATWVLRVRTAAPTLSPHDAFVWAIRYQAAAASKKDTAALDLRLAREASRSASPSR